MLVLLLLGACNPSGTTGTVTSATGTTSGTTSTTGTTGTVTSATGTTSGTTSTTGTTGTGTPCTSTTWYLDADGDGYGDPTTEVESCDAPSGYVGDAGDCDDGDAAIHPSAPDACGDGVDADCDGVDGVCLPSGTVAVEDAARTVFQGGAEGDQAGYAVAGPGDVNGDGVPDLLVGAPGRDGGGSGRGVAHLLWGPPSPGTVDLASAGVELVGSADSDEAGWRVAGAGDVDGDGLADLLVAAPNTDAGGYSDAGSAYLLTGGDPGHTPFDLAGATLRLDGAYPYDHVGHAIGGAGDVNGDGYDDIVLGVPYVAAYFGWIQGSAYLVFGPPPTGAGSLYATADLEIRSDVSGEFGRSVAGAGDVDGDGFADLLVGHDTCSTIASRAGCAYLFLGPLAPGTLDASAADAKFLGESGEDYAGWSVAGAGDVDGDGYDDILVGAYGRDDLLPDAGAVYIVLGPPAPGVQGLGTADAVYAGVTASARAGYAVAGAGDVDGDGYDDILVGADQDATADDTAGAAHLLLGPPAPGAHGLDEAHATLLGGAAYDHAGYSVAGVDDVDGDGYPDFLVGAHGVDLAGAEAGAAYLLPGGT